MNSSLSSVYQCKNGIHLHSITFDSSPTWKRKTIRCLLTAMPLRIEARNRFTEASCEGYIEQSLSSIPVVSRQVRMIEVFAVDTHRWWTCCLEVRPSSDVDPFRSSIGGRDDGRIGGVDPFVAALWTADRRSMSSMYEQNQRDVFRSASSLLLRFRFGRCT